MTNADAPPRAGKAVAFEVLAPLAALALGLVMAHHPMIFSGLASVQTDLGDSRLINYILEHSYRWIRSEPNHRRFWSPPFFYPAVNVAAYSDVLLTVAPIYWAWRAFGAAPDTAFQLWMMSVSALNFAAGYALFRLALRMPWPSSTAGAFLIAFGAPRVNQVGHQQLLPFFYGLVAMIGVVRAFKERDGSLKRRGAWWLVASLGLVAQLYAGFYLGWFLIFGAALAFSWALMLPSCRGALLGVLARDSPLILLAGAIGAAALAPFLAHYTRAAQDLGPRWYPGVRASILRPWSWLHVGPGHWIWGWTADLPPFRALPGEVEHRLGLGLVTISVCVTGLYLGRREPLMRLSAFVAASLWVVATYLPGVLLADLALATALVGAARFYSDREHPGLKFVVAAALVALVTFERFPSWRVLGLAFFLLALVLLTAFRVHSDRLPFAAAVGLAIWLCLALFDVRVMAIVLGLIAPLALAAAYFRVGDWGRNLVAGMAAMAACSALLSHLDRPKSLAIGLLAPLVLVPALRRDRLRVPPRALAIAVVAALPVIVLFEFNDTLWIYVFEKVPGGSAIRAVGRVGLLMLVPAAIGLAAFFAAPATRRRPVLACGIGLACLAEQGITTPSYDKAANRARIEMLATRVDRRAEAFYYRPSTEGTAPWKYHLDAMWASLESRVPTVNGYSGGTPPGWWALVLVDQEYGPEVGRALAEWLRARRLPPERVQRID